MKQNRFEGTIPSAETLAKYENIAKGSATQLVEILKREQLHRHKLQRRYAASYRLGQLFSFVLNIYIVTLLANMCISAGQISFSAYIIGGCYIMFLLVSVIESRKDRKALAMKNTQHGHNQNNRRFKPRNFNNKNYGNNKR